MLEPEVPSRHGREKHLKDFSLDRCEPIASFYNNVRVPTQRTCTRSYRIKADLGWFVQPQKIILRNRRIPNVATNTIESFTQISVLAENEIASTVAGAGISYYKYVRM